MNFLAIFAGAAATFVIGFLFHGPLFGKVWMKLANIHPTGKEKFSDMVPQMLQNYIAKLVTAFVLSGALWIAFSSPFMGPETWYKGAICAIWLWLGFLVTSSSIEVIWMKRNYKLWLFECASSFFAMAAMGAVLGAWR